MTFHQNFPGVQLVPELAPGRATRAQDPRYCTFIQLKSMANLW